LVKEQCFKFSILEQAFAVNVGRRYKTSAAPLANHFLLHAYSRTAATNS